MSETLYNDIRTAFGKHLENMPDSPDVAWENFTYHPVVGKPYLVPAFLPGEPNQVTIGTDGLNEEVGIYQITLTNFQEDTGSAEMFALAGKVRAWFKRGTELTFNGLTIRIKKAFASPVTPNSEIHVSIDFYLQTSN